jgi:hypothetical protein
MTPVAEALTEVLLTHHAQVCRMRGNRPPSIDSCVIVYGDLCERAGVPHLTRSVGNFLQEVAEWCEENGWPPLNSLAVNEQSRMPGEGYHLAPGCNLLEWPSQAEACIAFRGYPERL